MRQTRQIPRYTPAWQVAAPVHAPGREMEMVETQSEMAWLHQAMAFLVARQGKRGAARLLEVARPTLEDWLLRDTPTPRMREAVERVVQEMGELSEGVQADRLDEVADAVEQLKRQVGDLAERLKKLEGQQTAMVAVNEVVEAPDTGSPLRRLVRGLFGGGRT